MASKLKKYRYRSAATGRFVSKLFAAAFPRKTVREEIKEKVVCKA